MEVLTVMTGEAKEMEQMTLGQMSLFQEQVNMGSPLASRLRPESLDDYVGQEHLVGKGKVLRQMIEKDMISSMIFWGPPGVGKTTLARIIAHMTHASFIDFSAVTSGIKEIKEVMKRAEDSRMMGMKTIVFVDEIHRFNKAQQDAFLPHVESGLISLIGATTENPSFEVISPLISRSRVIVLQQLTSDSLKQIIKRAITAEHLEGRITDDAIDTIALLAHGDARSALGNLEIAEGLISGDQKITAQLVEEAAGKKLPRYDKKDDSHYDTISAFIKSMRGSDETAAMYYLARMVQAGEDPKFIARRMVIFASEDIGLAGNGALNLAVSCFNAIERVGMPEGGIILSHVVAVLCRAHKSRESYNEWKTAKQLASLFPDSTIPLQIRNGETKLMKDLGYGKGYKWEAGFHGTADYLPDDVRKYLNQQKRK